MKYIKNFSISIGIILVLSFIFTFLISLLSYFDILKGNGIHVMAIVLYIISLFLGGFFLGKRSHKKGWLEGLKLGVILILFFILANVLFIHNPLIIKSFIFYFLLLISSIMGSMIGINIKKEAQK